MRLCSCPFIHPSISPPMKLLCDDASRLHITSLYCRCLSILSIHCTLNKMLIRAGNAQVSCLVWSIASSIVTENDHLALCSQSAVCSWYKNIHIALQKAVGCGASGCRCPRKESFSLRDSCQNNSVRANSWMTALQRGERKKKKKLESYCAILRCWLQDSSKPGWTLLLPS